MSGVENREPDAQRTTLNAQHSHHLATGRLPMLNAQRSMLDAIKYTGIKAISDGAVSKQKNTNKRIAPKKIKIGRLLQEMC